MDYMFFAYLEFFLPFLDPQSLFLTEFVVLLNQLFSINGLDFRRNTKF